MKIPSTHITRSARGTMGVARRLASVLGPGAVVGLTGDLGAGKTVFARGLARAWGVPEDVPVTSPTFTVVNVYLGRFQVYHFDLYRLSDVDELEAVGYRDYIGGQGAAVLEWADRVPEALGPDGIMVTIEDGESPRERVIAIRRVGRGAE